MILVRCKGGLGNQLFQYAAARALAARHGVPLRIDDRWYRSDENQRKVHRSFELAQFQIAGAVAGNSELAAFGTNDPSRARRLAGRVRRAFTGRDVWVQHAMGYDARFEQLGPDTALEGFFQHPHYFSAVAADVRREFRLRGAPPAAAATLAAELAAQASVCVQVRRGDYVTQGDSAALHGVCGVEYYQRAWAALRERVPQARAWIYTDDGAWAREQLGAMQPAGVIEEELGGAPFLWKFHVMQACRHFISANSTFGWWAAWLGARPDSVVVVPRHWLRERDIDELGLRLPGWLAC